VAALTSIQNPLIKSVRRAISRGGTTADGLCVAEGFHLLAEALRSGCEVAAVLATEAAAERAAVPVHTISDAVFREISTTETSQGIIALVRPPSWRVEDVRRGETLMVVLDGIQEPGNAGAILRAAEAFGASGAVFLKGAVDPYNPKCLRASAGSIFRLPVLSGMGEDELDGALAGVTVYAAMPKTAISVEAADLSRPCALVIGSEGRGVRAAMLRRATGLRIPTTGVESLNAAVAAGILLYEARRQRSVKR